MPRPGTRELALLDLINAKRAEGFTCPDGTVFPANGEPLVFDCRMWRAARFHSQDMANTPYFSHKSQGCQCNGEQAPCRCEEAGVSCGAESIVAGSGDPADTLDQMLTSELQLYLCTNIGKADYTMAAVGYAVGDDPDADIDPPTSPANDQGDYKGHYWTILFGPVDSKSDDDMSVPDTTSCSTGEPTGPTIAIEISATMAGVTADAFQNTVFVDAFMSTVAWIFGVDADMVTNLRVDGVPVNRRLTGGVEVTYEIVVSAATAAASGYDDVDALSSGVSTSLNAAADTLVAKIQSEVEAIATAAPGDQEALDAVVHAGQVTSIATNSVVVLRNQLVVMDSTNLVNARGVAVAPDNKNVYAVSRGNSLESGFGKDLILSSIVTYARDATTGALTKVDAITDSTFLDSASGVAVAPDNNNVYAVASGSDSIVTYARDLDGKLELVEGLTDAALDGVNDVAVAPDGENVYAVGFFSNSIVTYDRDSTTGALSNQRVITDYLDEARGLAVAPDGQNVYAVAQDRIITWDRDAATGTLSNQRVITGSRVGAVAVAPDGKNVYAVSGRSIVTWDRDATTGTLSNQRAITETMDLDQARGLAVAPDGQNVYAVGQFSKSIVDYARDAEGTLTKVDVITDSENLDGAWSVAVAPDGENVYAVAYVSDSIVTWDRAPASSRL